MRDLVAEAVRFAITTEKGSYDFYRKAAMAADQAGRRIFEQLAREESKHIDALLREHPGSWWDPLQRRIEAHAAVDARRHDPAPTLMEQLHLALLDKRFSIDLYTTLSRSFREPSVCRVFEHALATAREEFRLINEKYLVAALPASAKPSHRLPRRSHVREGMTYAAPNKHTQPYFSMLDTGRPSRLG